MWTSRPAGRARSRREVAVLVAYMAVATIVTLPPSQADARMRDRDGDGLSNRGERTRTHTNPRRADTDRDGLRDRFELKRSHTNPRRKDTDRDGLRDRFELRRSKTNPRKKDTDGDGLNDRFELRRSHTNPRRKDTDGDGYPDGVEVMLGSNPRKRKSVPSAGAGPQAPAVPLWTCNRNATPSTFAAEVSAATPGQTVCLASGGYGTFQGTNKAITIRAALGATPTMRYQFGSGDSGFTLDGLSGMGGNLGGGVSNVTVRNSAFNTCAEFSGSNNNVVFEWNTHININATCGNSRLGLNGSGVTIRASLMHGGDADGAFISSNGVTVEGNRFIGLCQGPTGNHTDGLQFGDPGDASGGYNAVVRGNYFADTQNCGLQSLTSYDSGTKGALIENNVVDTTRPWGIELYSDEGSIVRHNTVRWYPDSQCVFGGLECGQIDITRKSADPPSTGTQVYDNVAVVGAREGSSVARNDHNVDPQTVTYVGPLTTWGGFHLAAGSVGKGAASDGRDVGIP
jgi:Bacterial TSP3 repeat